MKSTEGWKELYLMLTTVEREEMSVSCWALDRQHCTVNQLLTDSYGIIVVNQSAWLLYISPSLPVYVCKCVCACINMHVCMYVSVYVRVDICESRGQRKILDVLLYGSLLDSLETGSLTEPKRLPLG